MAAPQAATSTKRRASVANHLTKRRFSCKMRLTTPVVNDTENMEESFRHLQKLGFTDYEARAYVALLRDFPATRYQLSQNASIPESKIYEVVRRLQDKGVINGLQGHPPRFVPLPPNELMSQLERRTQESLQQLRDTFSRLKERPAGQWIWNIEGYDDVISQAKDLVAAAAEEISVAMWHEEAEILKPALRTALDRQVNVFVLAYDRFDIDFGTVKNHGFELDQKSMVMDLQGRWLAIVVDRKQVLLGSSLGSSATGVWTNHSTLAGIVQRYIGEHFHRTSTRGNTGREVGDTTPSRNA